MRLFLVAKKECLQCDVQPGKYELGKDKKRCFRILKGERGNLSVHLHCSVMKRSHVPVAPGHGLGRGPHGTSRPGPHGHPSLAAGSVFTGGWREGHDHLSPVAG